MPLASFSLDAEYTNKQPVECKEQQIQTRRTARMIDGFTNDGPRGALHAKLRRSGVSYNIATPHPLHKGQTEPPLARFQEQQMA